MPDPIQPAVDFLNQDVLTNIVLLKMLQAYGDQIQITHVKQQAAEGVLLLLPTSLFSFDARTYPATQYVVLLSTTDTLATASLVPAIPFDCPLIFKFVDIKDRLMIERHYPLQRQTAFLSFTTPPNYLPQPDPAVAITTTVNHLCLHLFAAMGHPPAEVRPYFDKGQALCFALYSGGSPISACFAYLNYGSVWEIGGVVTRPQERRKGYARKIVATAVATLLQADLNPRYQVHEQNAASIQLAESLELKRFVTVEHYLYQPH